MAAFPRRNGDGARRLIGRVGLLFLPVCLAPGGCAVAGGATQGVGQIVSLLFVAAAIVAPIALAYYLYKNASD